VIDGIAPTPNRRRLKFPAPTPVTGSLNVTVQETLDAFVGLGSPSVIELTVGAVVSLTMVVMAEPVSSPPLVAHTRIMFEPSASEVAEIEVATAAGAVVRQSNAWIAKRAC